MSDALLNSDTDERKRIDLLKQLEVFKNVKEEHIALVLPICRSTHFFKGETIIEDNTFGDELYVIINGEVSIQLEAITPHFDVAITKLCQGQVIGELALIDNEPRSAKATCLTNCECLVISGKELRKIFDLNPEMGYRVMHNLAKIISGRIRKTNRRLLNVVRSKLF